MTSLNPLHTIERQIGESLALHQGLAAPKARARILELLTQVGIRDAEARIGAYPHQLSGGQRQRVMIAMALANGPDVLIADEPTTALDVTIQAQILTLLADIQKAEGMGMLFITHNLGIVRRIADRVAVMQAGEIVETGPTRAIFADPSTPTPGCCSPPSPPAAPTRCRPTPPHGARDRRDSGSGSRSGAASSARPSATSRRSTTPPSPSAPARPSASSASRGSGKTTLALAIMRLISSEGRIVFLGQDIQGWKSGELRQLRRDMQMVFQDPYGSLSPAHVDRADRRRGPRRPQARQRGRPRRRDPQGGRPRPGDRRTATRTSSPAASASASPSPVR